MRSILVLSLLVVSACGDDGGSSAADARLIGDTAPVECAAVADYGAVTNQLEPYASRDADTNPGFIGYAASLNMDFDDLSIELVKEYGVFTTGEIVPGSYRIEGAETKYDTCGVCVFIYGNYDPNTEVAAMEYLAWSGTLNITSVSPNLTGSLINASFRHVEIDGDLVTTDHPDGCTSTIGSITFDTMVVTVEPKK